MVERKNKIELENFIENIVTKITNDFEVDEIVLFGSYAKDTAHAWSDVDLAVISPDLDSQKLIYENVRTIRKKTKLYEPYLQLFAFQSKVFYEETFIDPSFIKEIKTTGRKVYTKAEGLIHKIA